MYSMTLSSQLHLTASQGTEINNLCKPVQTWTVDLNNTVDRKHYALIKQTFHTFLETADGFILSSP